MIFATADVSKHELLRRPVLDILPRPAPLKAVDRRLSVQCNGVGWRLRPVKEPLQRTQLLDLVV